MVISRNMKMTQHLALVANVLENKYVSRMGSPTLESA